MTIPTVILPNILLFILSNLVKHRYSETKLSVNATFSNIELKADGKYYADKIWGTHDFTTNKGIKADASGYAASKRVTIKGKVKGLASGQDWDSAYEQVSGIIQFVN